LNIFNLWLAAGLPFSDKKIITRNTEQEGTGGGSIGIPPFRGREKSRNFVPNHFTKEKTPQNSFPNHLWKRINFGIPFRTNSRNRKHSKIHSKPFLGTENNKKMTFVSCFVKLHYFAEFHSVSF
jgi:hypothetical protein